jgi:hypothetical protein
MGRDREVVAAAGAVGVGEVGEVDIPRWLAEKNNLEYED